MRSGRVSRVAEGAPDIITATVARDGWATLEEPGISRAVGHAPDCPIQPFKPGAEI